MLKNGRLLSGSRIRFPTNLTAPSTRALWVGSPGDTAKASHP